jgi:hypothetical protein
VGLWSQGSLLRASISALFIFGFSRTDRSVIDGTKLTLFLIGRWADTSLIRKVIDMTKILLNPEASLVFKMLKSPLGVLLHPGVLAHHESKGAIYIADTYADVMANRLTEAGLTIEVVTLSRPPVVRC